MLPWLALTGLSAQAQEPCSLIGGSHSAIERLCAVHEGMARFMINGAWGFMDKSGQVVSEPRFDEAEDFSEGLAAVQLDGRWGFIDKTGKLVIQPAFRYARSFSSGLAAVDQAKGGDCDCDGRSGYIDRNGQWVIDPVYEQAGPFQGETAMVSEGYRNNLLIDRRGQVLRRFETGLRVNEYPNAWGLYAAEREGARFLWNREGQHLPVPRSVNRVVGEGLLLASETGPDQRTRWGAVDFQGKWVVPARFESLEDFQEGLAIAQQKQETGDSTSGETLRYGLINRQGEFVLPPRYAFINRTKWGGYEARQSDDADDDGIDMVGKDGQVLLPHTTCEHLKPVEITLPVEPLQWGLVTGCGQSWAFHPQAGMMHSRIAEPEAYASGEHLMVIQKREGGEDGTRAPLQFDIFDTAGQRVFSSDDAAMQGDQALTGRYDDVYLLPAAAGSTAQRALLPLALLVREFKTVQVVTREGKVLSDPRWSYDDNLNRYYRYASSGKPVEGPLVIRTERDVGAFGAVDGQGQWIVPPRYDRLSSFDDGVAFGAVDSQWVMVESNGKTHVLPKNAGRFARVAPGVFLGEVSSEEDNEYVRLDLATGQTTQVKMPDAIRTTDFHDGLVVADSSGANPKRGLVNDRGNWVIQPRYDGLEAVVDKQERLIGWRSTAYFKDNDSTKSLYGWLDPQGKELVAPRYRTLDYDAEHGVLRIIRDEQFHGILATDGTLLLEPKYKQIDVYGQDFIVTEPTLYGLLDAKGEWSAPLSALTNFSDLREQPYQTMSEGAERVLVDLQGRRSTANAPLALTQGQDRPQWWWSKTEGPWDDKVTVFYGYDFKERVRIPGELPWYARFSDGVISFTPNGVSRGEAVALADTTGKVLGRYLYKEIGPVTEGLATFQETVPRATNTAKRKKSPASQTRDDDDADEERTRMGYLDRTGKLAIAPVFDQASDFAEGRATVVAKGNIGLIDAQGKLVAHSAWLCAREPVILNAAGKVQWPAAAVKKKKC